MRPDELHASMRSDLVCILRDVVALIARLEATIPSPSESDIAIPPGAAPASPPAVERPIALPLEGEPAPQPAPFPKAQSEGFGIQGEDQQAQKEGAGPAAPSAGAAPAETGSADPRNSSRPAAEASAPAAARTEPTKQERVLTLWSTTDLTRHEIADRVGCSDTSVSAYLSIARKAGDPRGSARSVAEDAPRSELREAARKPVLIKKAPAAEQDDRGPAVAGFAKPAEPKPFSEPVKEMKPERLIGVVIDQPGTVVSIDTNMGVVACPGGDWQASLPVIRTITKMRNGDLFDCKTLADIGDWSSVDHFLNHARAWQRGLAERGVDLVIMPKIGCRLRRAGE